MTSVSEILQETEKKIMDNYQEKIKLTKYLIIKEFLDSLVSCGELTETNRRRIEGNRDMKDFFPQTPEEMEMSSTEGEEDEEEEVFRGRTTFPKEKSEQTNDFIKDYIEKEWPELNVKEPQKNTTFWKESEERDVIYRYSRDGVVLLNRDIIKTMILHGHLRPKPVRKMPEDNLYGTVSGTYSDGNPYKIDLRGKKFKELDELLCIL